MCAWIWDYLLAHGFPFKASIHENTWLFSIGSLNANSLSDGDWDSYVLPLALAFRPTGYSVIIMHTITDDDNTLMMSCLNINQVIIQYIRTSWHEILFFQGNAICQIVLPIWLVKHWDVPVISCPKYTGMAC